MFQNVFIFLFLFLIYNVTIKGSICNNNNNDNNDDDDDDEMAPLLTREFFSFMDFTSQPPYILSC